MHKDQLKGQVSSYYDEVADIYSDLYTDELSRAENKIVQGLMEQYLPKKDTRVLDLGSGHGLALDMVHWKDYVGIDISPDMVREAKKQHPNAKFLVGDMEQLEFKDKEFDYVISLFGSVSHSLSPYLTISEILRVLKPGGKAFIMLYSQYSLNNMINVFKKGGGLESISPIQEYEIRNLKVRGSFARFYSKKKLLHLFRDYKNINIFGLNALYELEFLKKHIQHNSKAYQKLKRDMLVTKLNPNWGHSLIVIAEKPK